MVHSQGHWRLKPVLKCCGGAEQKGVQSDGQQSAGDDQALAFGWKQTKCNAELGEDKGELSNLCQTGGNDESRVVGPRSKRTIRSAAAKKRALKAFWTGCNCAAAR